MTKRLIYFRRLRLLMKLRWNHYLEWFNANNVGRRRGRRAVNWVHDRDAVVHRQDFWCSLSVGHPQLKERVQKRSGTSFNNHEIHWRGLKDAHNPDQILTSWIWVFCKIESRFPPLTIIGIPFPHRNEGDVGR